MPIPSIMPKPNSTLEKFIEQHKTPMQKALDNLPPLTLSGTRDAISQNKKTLTCMVDIGDSKVYVGVGTSSTNQCQAIQSFANKLIDRYQDYCIFNYNPLETWDEKKKNLLRQEIVEDFKEVPNECSFISSEDVNSIKKAVLKEYEYYLDNVDKALSKLVKNENGELLPIFKSIKMWSDKILQIAGKRSRVNEGLGNKEQMIKSLKDEIQIMSEKGESNSEIITEKIAEYNRLVDKYNASIATFNSLEDERLNAIKNYNIAKNLAQKECEQKGFSKGSFDIFFNNSAIDTQNITGIDTELKDLISSYKTLALQGKAANAKEIKRLQQIIMAKKEEREKVIKNNLDTVLKSYKFTLSDFEKLPKSYNGKSKEFEDMMKDFEMAKKAYYNQINASNNTAHKKSKKK